MKHIVAGVSRLGRHKRLSIVLTFAVVALLSITTTVPFTTLSPTPTAKANSTYFDLAAGTQSYGLSAATAGQIATNDNWSSVASVEGYAGLNLTATHGIDPQTVLGTEFASHQLPNTPTNVAANKSNPSAFNAGGVAEFDSGTFLAIGIQGNTNSNPYLVFYLNTTGRTNVTMSYTVQDIDGGSNNAVSQLALQYRVGQTGLFTNVPAGYIADVTVGGATGPAQNMNVVLPAAVNNQPQVQVRLITTNAANTSGGSTSDEWIGINNVSFSSSFAPTAAGVTVGGRVVAANGMGIRGALVTLWDSTGNSRTATTSSFGYYRFADVEVGQTYIFSVSSKRYTFANPTIVRSVSDSIADIDFVEEGAPPILNVAPSREVKVTSPRKAVRD